MSAALVRSDATAIPLGDNTVDLIVTSPARVAAKTDGERQMDLFGAIA